MPSEIAPAGLRERKKEPDADLRAAVIACAALSAVRAVLRTRRARRASGITDTGPAPLPLAFDFLREIGSPLTDRST
jgi:hypothetical protein